MSVLAEFIRSIDLARLRAVDGLDVAPRSVSAEESKPIGVLRAVVKSLRLVVIADASFCIGNESREIESVERSLPEDEVGRPPTLRPVIGGEEAR